METIALDMNLMDLWERQHPKQMLRELDPEEWQDLPECPGCGRPWGDLDCGSGSDSPTCEGSCQDGSGWSVFVAEPRIDEDEADAN